MKTFTIAAVTALLLACPIPGHADDDTHTISISFEDTDIRDAITSIARFAEANVIVSPAVKGKITVNLQKAPWKAALKQIVESAGFRLVEEDYGILRVVPREDLEPREPAAHAARADAKRAEAAAARKAADPVSAKLDEARRRVEALRARTAESPNEHGETVLQVYDIRHLAKGDTPHSVWNFDDPKYGVTEVRVDGATLVIRATRAGHKHIAAKLGALLLQRGERVRAEKLKTEAEGWFSRAHGDALRRAEHLEQAAENLRAAGMMEEAAKARRQAKDLRAASQHAHKSGQGNLIESVNALRHDVAALRKQMAELTALVRRLFGQRVGQRGGAGGAGGSPR